MGPNRHPAEVDALILRRSRRADSGLAWATAVAGDVGFASAPPTGTALPSGRHRADPSSVEASGAQRDGSGDTGGLRVEEQQGTTGKSGYRPALDGLRALAVGAVIAYHGGLAAMPGGLLGVDAFFVLSGFLITMLLLSEHSRTGRIALRSFWASRARRLLPALLLLLTATMVYAVTLADPENLSRLRGDALSALAYVANWHFAFTHQSYFDHFAAPSPLLHLWSLGVEEQFYLIWPLAVVLLLRRRGRWAVFLLACVLATCSAGAAGALSLSGADPSRIYYGTDTRAQALVVGAALAALLLDRSVLHRRVSRVLVHLVGLAGIAGFAWCLFRVDGESPGLDRGGFLLVALAVAAVLANVTLLPRGPLARVLSVQPLRGIGRISYGLYLWHWPIFVVVTHDRTGLAPLPLAAVRVGATVAVAVVSYWLLEQPIRARRFRIPIPRVAVPALVILMATGLVLTTTLRSAGNAAQQPLALDQLAAAAQQQPLAADSAKNTQNTRVLMVGDSVALTLAAGLAPLQQQYHVEVANRGWVGCGIARKTEAFDGARYYPAWADCAQWPTKYAAWRDAYRPDVAVLVIGRWEVVDRKFDGHWTHIGDPRFDAYLATELDNAVSVLSKRGAKVVLTTAPIYHARELADGSSSPVNDPSRVARLNQLIRQAVDRHPGTAYLYDLEHVLCPDDQYHQELNGTQVRFDDGIHIASGGAALIAQTLMPQLSEIKQSADADLRAAPPPLR